MMEEAQDVLRQRERDIPDLVGRHPNLEERNHRVNWHRVAISEWERRYQRHVYAASQLPRVLYIDFLRRVHQDAIALRGVHRRVNYQISLFSREVLEDNCRIIRAHKHAT